MPVKAEGLTQISVEEALQYIPCSEIYFDSAARMRHSRYFTLAPISGSHVEKVTYYTGQLRDSMGGDDGKDWVYVLSSPVMPGLLKIGYTKANPRTRALQLSAATGVPKEFKVEYAHQCREGAILEKRVHQALDSFRINSHREFFRIPLQEAIDTVQKLNV